MKQTVLSGIQPTGRIHVGNYLGALKHWVELQESNEYICYFFIADLHSLTIEIPPKERLQNIIDVAATYLAIGLNPKKSTLFIQSHISAHAELNWILSGTTPLGELGRMTQFKDKSASGNNNAGLLTYPILQAADIILYDTNLVPVGEDQLQHLELSRIITRKFNHRFGETFVEPKPLMTAVPRLMSLADPTKKMSKSSPNGCLFIDDDPATIRAKISKAVTDTGNEIKYDPEKKPGISNLLRIASAFSEKPIQEIEQLFQGTTKYGDFKKYVAEVIIDALAPITEKKAALLKNPKKVMRIFEKSARTAEKNAEKKMDVVRARVGLPN